MSVTDVFDQPAEAPAASPPPTRSTNRRASGLGGLLVRLHFYTGVLVAPFLLVAAVTGLLYTATPQLDQLFYGDKLTVAHAGATAKPLAEQVAAARGAHPEGSLMSVIVGDSDATTQVVFSMPELGEKQHTVYVDPYTAEVKGTLTTWWGSTPATTWLDDLHRNLHLGDLGRYYSEFAASWLWVLALGGLALWWRRQRGANPKARRLLLPDLTARKGVRRTRGWHAATGVWIAVGLLILSATGLTWSRYAGGNFDNALTALDARQPQLATALAGGAPAAGGGHHGGSGVGEANAVDPAAADTVLRIARDHDLAGPIEISIPEDATRAWTVTQVDNTWPVHLDRAAIDPATSTVVARSNFTDWPLLAQLSKLGIQAHMGRLFGIANQILLAALALGLLCVIVWGYRMWWQRRPTRADRRATVGTPPERGAWQKLPASAIAVGVPVVFAIGWALPMFGIPLAAFLVLDVIIGVARGRRDQPAPVSPAPASQ
ncbi:PepSY-associated TM helix domain-containing protein [Micromonospora sp. CB01531]|uniref:PepSY-associated TM helix domain-containing protein n=1 Tax=Micromonospora sp. CB01531 TaxID=1718947 RepID=UPI00093D3291|nr:PepSY domain-containing protein [Micromonospora sp. CB01531]OKI71658.1 peptidase [Micromonospora sp. CB01531]